MKMLESHKKVSDKTNRPDAYKHYVRAMAGYLRTQYFHGEYYMDIYWHKDLDDGNSNKKGTTYMSISASHTYLDLELNVSDHVMSRYEAKDYAYIGRAMCHEFAHLLTNPLYDLAALDIAPSQEREFAQTRERQTQRIANIVMSLLPKNWYEPKVIAKLAK